MNWCKKGFEGFSKGTLGNGGQNLYVSRKGVLQRIYQYDVNGDGYPDLLFANSQSMGECPPLYVYDMPLQAEKRLELPTNGCFDGLFADLTGDGYEDLVIACQNNGTLSDVAAVVYFSSPEGLSERYRLELPAPDATCVAAGDFRGRGRRDLVFLCGNFLRVFYQTELGLEACKFQDYPIPAASMAGGDLDGDGYDDLLVRLTNGALQVYWGGPEGISPERATLVSGQAAPGQAASSTTPGRRPMYSGWRAGLLPFEGALCLFREEADQLLLECFDGGRRREEALRLPCGGITSVASGALGGRACLAVTRCVDRNAMEDSLVLWADCGYDPARATPIPARSARYASIGRVDGEDALLLCQGATRTRNSVTSQVLFFRPDGTVARRVELPSENAAKVLAGRTGRGEETQLVVLNHESGTPQGDESVSIFLGGPDGYQADRRIDLPGWAAVDGTMVDYNDDGLVDVLVSNCAENAPELDPGSFLYINSPQGFSAQRRLVIPTVRGHGAAVGDFRRCGYLDIASGGYHNQAVTIFEGGPWGYDLEHSRQIVFGPHKKPYQAPKPASEEEIAEVMSSEPELYNEFGETRWLYAADFNGDGWLDLFVSQIVGPHCYILWGGPEGFDLSRSQTLATDGVAAANAADLNGDGWLDLILAGHMSTKKNCIYESYLTIYWGGPEGYRENRKTQLPVHCAHSVCVGDFNGDGILDLYASAYNNGRERDLDSYVYYGSPDGAFHLDRRGRLFNHSGSGCLAGDFNGDGYTDIAVACHKAYGNHVAKSRIFWGGPDGPSEEHMTELPTVGPHGMSVVDPGNVMDRGDCEEYFSEVYEIPQDMKPFQVHWEAELGVKNWVSMRLRAAETEAEVQSAPWSERVENGETVERLNLKGRYLQYQLELGAKCGCGTPRVHSVTVEFREK